MESDRDTTVGELREAIADSVAERSWQRFHTRRNLAISMAIEAAELLELFQWETPEYAPNPPRARESGADIADEMADVLIYCLALANRADIDLSTAIRAKLGRNAERYPIGSKPP